MKGSMRERGAAWELRVYLGHDPLTGKKRYTTRTVRGGQREAQTAGRWTRVERVAVNVLAVSGQVERDRDSESIEHSVGAAAVARG